MFADSALSDIVGWGGLKWPHSFLVTAVLHNALFWAFGAPPVIYLPRSERHRSVQAMIQHSESASLADGLRLLGLTR